MYLKQPGTDRDSTAVNQRTYLELTVTRQLGTSVPGTDYNNSEPADTELAVQTHSPVSRTRSISTEFGKKQYILGMNKGV